MRKISVLMIALLLSIPIFGQVWVARYDGPDSAYDKASAIAVDGAGNIYVTGMSRGSTTFHDYATVKYDPAGNELWVRRYNGPDNGDDEASAIVVDEDYVYVTGGSANSDLYFDCVTVKYDSSGDSVWAVRYDGPSSDNDYPYSIAVDGSRNVYVAGYDTGPDTWWDHATIKYTSSGTQEWVRRWVTNDFDYAIAIAVDADNNVYVIGITGDPYSSAWDYLTIKYSSSGDSLWARKYDGPANDYDQASAIAIDGSGNVYVTGGSAGSGTGWDYTTIKYDSLGDSLWVRRYDGPANGADWANAVAVDGAGNVYVTGYSEDPTTNSDYATVKYNPSGVEQWVARYDGPGNGCDEAIAIVVDESGNTYITGSSYRTGTDYATVKYNSSGVEQWVERYDGPANGNDYAYTIAIDGSDYVYVTGESQGSGTGYDYATIKYSCAGVEETNGQLSVSNCQLAIRPNPFRLRTVISYQLAVHSNVSLTIHDVTGRVVATLTNEEKEPGSHSVRWNAEGDHSQDGCATGLYFARLAVGNHEEVQKVILVR
jgi:hypothetical protein